MVRRLGICLLAGCDSIFAFFKDGYMSIYVGCAGWNLRRELAESFPAAGTHLERYAQVLNCVEINSSFYRSHQRKTYERWAETTPAEFRFAVKLPKQITHVRGATDIEARMERFVEEVGGLGEKLGPVLVQLPPSAEFRLLGAAEILGQLRARIGTPIVCEPRHKSWFELAAEEFMKELHIDRVAADPSILAEAANPGGCGEHAYFRWHGSPRMYYSEYDAASLKQLADRLHLLDQTARSVWCIFDNTALGAAQKNALEMMQRIQTRTDARA
jgi:uncharacterized protein YecE (DUF72 family)